MLMLFCGLWAVLRPFCDVPFLLVTFISPWPFGSPFYYPTSTANYAMEWAQGGYFLHDAPWRGYFGKGANYWHYDPKMGEDPGTHGRIDVPTPAMAQIFSWTIIGTTIQINA